MKGSLQPTELLDLIEDMLPAEEARALQDRLRKRPEVLQAIRHMRAHRALLQADPEPVLSDDLVEELESLLAKPMLLEADHPHAQPGAYRARHGSAARWPRMAIAAGLLIVAAASLVTLGQNLLQGQSNTNTIADTTPPPREKIDEALDEVLDSALAERPEGPVHHWDASPGAIEVRARGAEPTPLAEEAKRLEASALASGDSAYLSPMVLRIEDRAALDELSTLITDVQTAALVRNFTYAEARDAWTEMIAATDWPKDRQRQFIASMKNLEMWQGLTSQERQQVSRVARDTTRELGEHVSGDRSLEAPADWQLRFDESGRAYAVTLRLDDVAIVLDRLAELSGPAVALLQSEQSGIDTEDTWSRWRNWREAVVLLQQTTADLDREAYLVIPIELAGE